MLPKFQEFVQNQGPSWAGNVAQRNDVQRRLSQLDTTNSDKDTNMRKMNALWQFLKSQNIHPNILYKVYNTYKNQYGQEQQQEEQN